MESFAEIKKSLFVEIINAASESDAPQHCIMIIDDNADIIQALTSVLQSHYKVISCASYEEVKQKLSAEIKVILLDIKMGICDGAEVFKLLKEKREDLQIIFHSAYPGSSEKVEEVQKLSHSGYLTKGEYNKSELLAIIEKALNQSTEDNLTCIQLGKP